MEEIKLITEAKTGNQKAINSLFKIYSKKIKKFLMFKALGSIAEPYAEDLAQDSIIKALLKINSFDETKAKFSTWIHMVARNTMIDEIRKLERVDVSSIEGFIEDKNDNVGESGRYEIIFESDIPNPEKQMEMAQRKELVATALNILAGKDEDLFILVHMRYFEELSYLEIEQKTGLPLGSIKNKLHRAKQELSKICQSRLETV